MGADMLYKILGLILIIQILSGCAYQMQLMPRDSGKIYQGKIQSNGTGSGTISIQIENRLCSGSITEVSNRESFGFFQAYGQRGSATGSYQSFGGSSTYKALLSCSDSTGLRCDVEGEETGGGICVDSNQRVYDMIYK
jgi:hypothetical protein